MLTIYILKTCYIFFRGHFTLYTFSQTNSIALGSFLLRDLSKGNPFNAILPFKNNLQPLQGFIVFCAARCGTKTARSHPPNRDVQGFSCRGEQHFRDLCRGQVSYPSNRDMQGFLCRGEQHFRDLCRRYTVKRVSRICLKKVCGWEEARLKRHRKF
jgi:hypothetical protein